MDRVIETDSGFDCIVNGRRYGTWATHPIAKAGMLVEQTRAAGRTLTKEQWAEIATALCAE